MQSNTNEPRVADTKETMSKKTQITLLFIAIIGFLIVLYSIWKNLIVTNLMQKATASCLFALVPPVIFHWLFRLKIATDYKNAGVSNSPKRVSKISKEIVINSVLLAITYIASIKAINTLFGIMENHLK